MGAVLSLGLELRRGRLLGCVTNDLPRTPRGLRGDDTIKIGTFGTRDVGLGSTLTRAFAELNRAPPDKTITIRARRFGGACLRRPMLSSRERLTRRVVSLVSDGLNGKPLA